MSKKVCNICGEKIRSILKVKLKDGMVCNTCLGKLKAKQGKIADEIYVNCKNYFLDQVVRGLNGEEITKSIEFSLQSYWIVFNDDKKILMRNGVFKSVDISYDYIVGYNYLEDEKKYGIGSTIGKAAVGGILFGGAGAVIGALTNTNQSRKVRSMEIQLTLKNGKTIEYFPISIYKGDPIKVTSSYYKDKLNVGNKIMILLDEIINGKTQPVLNEINEKEIVENTNSENNLSELRELKSLLDEGILTQEEFNFKKKQILGI